jgi:hypothetical protein
MWLSAGSLVPLFSKRDTFMKYFKIAAAILATMGSGF